MDTCFPHFGHVTLVLENAGPRYIPLFINKPKFSSFYKKKIAVDKEDPIIQRCLIISFINSSAVALSGIMSTSTP